MTLVKYWIQGRKMLSLNFLLAAAAFALSATNPSITILRFFLSFVNLGAFFVNDHVIHVLSPACIGISGFQNQELLLVNSTLVLVWWLLGPMLYSLADIVCPMGGYTTSITSLLCVFDRTRLASVVAPLLITHDPTEDNDDASSSIGSLVVSAFSDSDNSSVDTESDVSDGEVSSSIGSVVVSLLNDSDISSIDTGSIVISEYQDSNCSGVDIDEIVESNNIAVSSTQDISTSRVHMPSRSFQDETENSCIVEVSEERFSFADEKNDGEVNWTPTVSSAYTGIMGMCRYSFSYAWLVISTDLFVVFAINVYLIRF